MDINIFTIVHKVSNLRAAAIVRNIKKEAVVDLLHSSI